MHTTTKTYANVKIAGSGTVTVTTLGWSMPARPRKWKYVYRSKGRRRGKRLKEVIR